MPLLIWLIVVLLFVADLSVRHLPTERPSHSLALHRGNERRQAGMRPAAHGRGFRARNPTIVRHWNEASLVATPQLRCYDDYHQGRLMHIETILADLRAERNRIEAAISALEAVNSTGRRRAGRPPRVAAISRRRGRMSAAARRKMSRLLKQRWAQGKMKPRAKAR